MAYKSIIAGAALIVVGVFGNIVSDTGSITTLIPAFIGVIFVALGVAGRAKPNLTTTSCMPPQRLRFWLLFPAPGQQSGAAAPVWRCLRNSQLSS